MAAVKGGLLSLVLLCGCSFEDGIVTLYRNSVTDETMRIHVATFDEATGGYRYNMENCQLAVTLFQNQDGVKNKFWCEKNRFKK